MSRIPEREDLQRALAARHGRAVQEKFNQATVAICGLGGLGSNIAIALARAGVGRLCIDSNIRQPSWENLKPRHWRRICVRLHHILR